MFIKTRKPILFSMFVLRFFLGPPLQRAGGPLQNFSKSLFQEPRRAVGNSFQPTIDTFQEALTNFVIAPSTKMEQQMRPPFALIENMGHLVLTNVNAYLIIFIMHMIFSSPRFQHIPPSQHPPHRSNLASSWSIKLSIIFYYVPQTLPS